MAMSPPLMTLGSGPPSSVSSPHLAASASAVGAFPPFSPSISTGSPETLRRPLRVFLSYVQREAQPIINLIVGALREQGFNIFDPAQRELSSRTDLQHTVQDSDLFLVVLTPGYFDDAACSMQVHVAMLAGTLAIAVNDNDAYPLVEGSDLMNLTEAGPPETADVRRYVFASDIVPVDSSKNQIGASIAVFIATVQARYVERMQHQLHPSASAAGAVKAASPDVSGPNLARLMLMVNEHQLTREQAVQYVEHQAAPVDHSSALSAAVAAAKNVSAAEEAAATAYQTTGKAKGSVRRPQDYREFAEDDSWLTQIPTPPPLEVPSDGWESVDDMIKAMIPVEALGLDRKRFNRWKRIHNVSFRGEDQKALTRIRRAELARLHARVARQQKRFKKGDTPPPYEHASNPTNYSMYVDQLEFEVAGAPPVVVKNEMVVNEGSIHLHTAPLLSEPAAVDMAEQALEPPDINGNAAAKAPPPHATNKVALHGGTTSSAPPPEAI
jgi:hypothetical protein